MSISADQINATPRPSLTERPKESGQIRSVEGFLFNVLLLGKDDDDEWLVAPVHSLKEVAASDDVLCLTVPWVIASWALGAVREGNLGGIIHTVSQETFDRVLRIVNDHGNADDRLHTGTAIVRSTDSRLLFREWLIAFKYPFIG